MKATSGFERFRFGGGSSVGGGGSERGATLADACLEEKSKTAAVPSPAMSSGCVRTCSLNHQLWANLSCETEHLPDPLAHASD